MTAENTFYIKQIHEDAIKKEYAVYDMNCNRWGIFLTVKLCNDKIDALGGKRVRLPAIIDNHDGKFYVQRTNYSPSLPGQCDNNFPTLQEALKYIEDSEHLYLDTPSLAPSVMVGLPFGKKDVQERLRGVLEEFKTIKAENASLKVQNEGLQNAFDTLQVEKNNLQYRLENLEEILSEIMEM
jgi:hypothetical protein